ncbi:MULTISPECIES: SDR family oxidoreductase [unclassified Microbacterium]|uniref:SDR family oxidoreductase n=1 Tax=unclassified Microbacterium TaxID=2609290 RepID=UPI000EAAB794|nr:MULTISPECIES: NAD(P)H-binding protein [unclassified Microbacterium]MBT2483537.1 NAD(P)H-binding protein [Microbacterium sp. ISL-108]RKN66550.1 NAD-dependent epimerase/dehydratase family protein [Microbacterium sp. CGR2]
MNAPLLVTGGTGNIGSRVVPLLRAAGRDIRIVSRHARPDVPAIQHVVADTVAGDGLAAALDGVDVVLHLAGGAKGDDIAARNLARGAREAGVKHLVLISVIGADRMPIGYFRAKAAAEQAIAESGVPWTVLRAAQLHDFVLPVARSMARMPILPVPGGLRFEPVDGDEVAARLAELALGAPAGRVADLAGPEVLDVTQLVSAFRDATGAGLRRGRLPIRLPGGIGRAYRAGDNLAGPDAQRGSGTWKSYLDKPQTALIKA